MTRPRKQTVDYFPHYCKHGKTLKIIQARFGNNGYAVWFKTLEILGATPGHKIDLSDEYNFEFFVAEMGVSVEETTEIMNLLAKLEAIDRQLWTKKRVIWSDNFIDEIAVVYSKRVVSAPEKPVSDSKTIVSGVNPVSEIPRVEESRVEESREKIIAPPPFFSCKFFAIDNAYRDKLLREYPALNEKTLKKELSKAEDWCVDNAKQRKKLKSNGQLSNPKLFLRNWLDKVIVGPSQESNLCGHGLIPHECKICRDHIKSHHNLK